MNVKFWLTVQDKETGKMKPFVTDECNVTEGQDPQWVIGSGDVLNAIAPRPFDGPNNAFSEFDPKNMHHWRMLPAVFSGTFHWVTVEE